MYYFAAAQKTSTLKLPATSKEFQTKERVLKVNKSEITGEDTFNGDHFRIQGNHKSSKGEKICFVFFLQICDPFFNP